MAANIHHSSSSVEWYTPIWLIEAIREVLGSIDCDPCSCFEAQKVVKAASWFDETIDGLSVAWWGNVFMNPPGGWAPEDVAKKWGSRSSAQCWHAYLEDQIKKGNVNNAIELCFNLDSLRAIQPDYPICILKKRCKFDKLENGKRVQGKSPAHGTGLILLTDSISKRKKFVEVMSKFGKCYDVI